MSINQKLQSNAAGPQAKDQSKSFASSKTTSVNNKKTKILPRITAPPEDISIMFGIPTNVLANWRWQGVGPRYYKRKRRITYFLEDVIAFIKEHPVLTSDSIPDEKKRGL